MPKITSTPTASRERTRLCAPVMPVAGSGTRAAGWVAVSTPASEAAASWVADSLGVLIAAFSWAVRRCGGRAVLLGAAGPDPANKKPLVPQARRGQRVGQGTDALGDYEEAAGRTHPHTVRLGRYRRQMPRPTQWTARCDSVRSDATSSRSSSKPSTTVRSCSDGT